MTGVSDLWLFVLAGVMRNLTPGPDMAFVMRQSARLGWRGGAAAAPVAMGVIFNATGTVRSLIIAWLSALVVASLAAGGRARLWLERTVFVGLGLKLALAQRSP